ERGTQAADDAAGDAVGRRVRVGLRHLPAGLRRRIAHPVARAAPRLLRHPFRSSMMDTIGYRKLRDFLQHNLGAAGDGDGFSDESPLFSSGRLDSLTMTRLVMFLEDTFGIDFAEVDF